MTDLRSQLQATLGDAYTLERELGGGGMSRVFVAEERALARKVVLKVLPGETAAQVSLERFKREILLAARLQHPHIVPLLSAGDANGLPYFTMPFVEGESLRARLARHGELPVADAVRILREIAAALTYAHERGIVHRDIKPDNVLLSGGSAMVTDFGVAKALSASSNAEHGGMTSLGVALGTPAYMAPEQATADPGIDHRADIYAFGVLAYELLTGQPPFTGRTPQNLLAAHVTEAPESIAKRRTHLPPGLAALVMRCLEKRPADRPQRAADIVSALDDITTPSGGMQPTSAVHATVPPAPTPTVGRRGVLVLAGVAVLVIGAVLAWNGTRGEGASSTAATGDQRHIAILPFENLGGDTANVYFADGMTDELANALAKVPGLRVASRTSSYAFRDAKSRNIGAIRTALGVGTLVEGTVSRSGDRLRVSARVTNATNGVEMWSDAFVRSAADVFAVQNELARAIVSALAPVLGGANAASGADTSHGTQDAVAYDLYLRARNLWYKRGVGSLRQSVALFREASARDPRFARAFAGIALATTTLADYEGKASPALAGEVERAAARAIALDSTLAEPHMALGYLHDRMLRAADAERSFQRAIALDPRSATAHQWYGMFYGDIGQADGAVRELRLANELDPLSAIIASQYASALGDANRIEEAQLVADRAIALDPQNSLVRVNVAGAMIKGGRARQVLTFMDEAERLGAPLGEVVSRRVEAMVALGDTAGARAALAAANEAMGASARANHNLADAWALVGDRQRALDVLEGAVGAGVWGILHRPAYLAAPAWTAFRDDRRFLRIIDRLGPAR